MSHIFISYSKQNRNYARKLADYLIGAGFNVWIDDRIDYGANWERAIFSAIDQCSAFVVIMTPQSYDSDWVQRECHHAEKRGKPAFPLLLDGEEFPRYGLTQYVDVQGERLPPADFLERIAQHLPRGSSTGSDVTNVDTPSAKPDTPTAKPLRPAQNPTPEQQHWLDILHSDDALPFQRIEAATKLSTPRDPRRGVGLRQDGIPDIDWVKIPTGTFTYQDNEIRDLPAFYIARYPVTFMQFQAFINDGNGYSNDAWWQGLAVRQREPGEQAFKTSNHPRETVSWYDAVAYTRWLSAQLSYEIRLPSEVEWEKAARGTDGRVYPWGDDFDPTLAHVNYVAPNADASFQLGTIPVGAYLHGASPYGILDMGGNVWEWCLETFDNPDNNVMGDVEPRVLRGGGWFNPETSAMTTTRVPGDADGRSNGVGFRLARSVPQAS